MFDFGWFNTMVLTLAPWLWLILFCNSVKSYIYAWIGKIVALQLIFSISIMSFDFLLIKEP